MLSFSFFLFPTVLLSIGCYCITSVRGPLDPYVVVRSCPKFSLSTFVSFFVSFFYPLGTFSGLANRQYMPFTKRIPFDLLLQITSVRGLADPPSCDLLNLANQL